MVWFNPFIFWHLLIISNLLPVIVALFRTMQRLTPLSCGAKLTQRVWRPSGRVQSMWYRCARGLWLALANTAARCASKPSQMVRIAEPGETALLPSRSILLCLVCFVSCTIALFFFFRPSCVFVFVVALLLVSEIEERHNVWLRFLFLQLN